MSARKVIYTLGSSHSGSTILNMLLSSGGKAVGLGAVWTVIREELTITRTSLFTRIRVGRDFSRRANADSVSFRIADSRGGGDGARLQPGFAAAGGGCDRGWIVDPRGGPAVRHWDRDSWAWHRLWRRQGTYDLAAKVSPRAPNLIRMRTSSLASSKRRRTSRWRRSPSGWRRSVV